MTVSSSLKQWLYNYPNIEIDERIDTELLEANPVAYAMAKEPTAEIESFLDGSQERTEYYMFRVRQSIQEEAKRISNDEFMENLETWIDEQNFEGNLPNLGDKKYAEEVSVSSSFYLFENDEENGVYTITIAIKYRKEF